MRKSVFVILFLALLSACNYFSDNGQKYSRLVKKELGKGVREDSMFLGIHLGMTSKEFYVHCWNLNKKGLITDGELNTAVKYKLKDELKYPAAMNFYPDFYEDKIAKMRVRFTYNEWAPWNKKMFADSLMPDVLTLYQKWYPKGNPFLTLQDSVRGTIHVKVDGNRRIIIGKYDERVVMVDYSDLVIEEKLKLLRK